MISVYKTGIVNVGFASSWHECEDSHVYTRNAAKAGLPMLAFIRINTPTRDYPRFLKLIGRMPEVAECHHVAGVDSFILKVRLASNAHLEAVLRQFSAFGETTTSIVLSSPVAWREISPLPQDAVAMDADAGNRDA